MKPFDIEAAKNGAKVMTRGGSPVNRFLAFDLKNETYPIVATIGLPDYVESVQQYTADGIYIRGREGDEDLVMAPVMKTFWRRLFTNKVDHIGYVVRDTPEYNERCTFKWIGEWEQFEVPEDC